MLTPRLASARNRSPRVLALLLLAAGAVTTLLAQPLPPPEEKPVVRPKPKPADTGGAVAPRSEGREEKGPSTALLMCDVACDITIDGMVLGSYPANVPNKIKLEPGEHLMRATNASEGCQKEQVVAGKGGQTVLQVTLKPTCASEFDKTMAQLWLAQQDFTLAGRWVESVPAKQFRSATPVDTAKLYASHQTMQQQLDALKTFTPADAPRQRIAEEMKRIGENANKYVEVLTQSITDAKGGKDKKGLFSMFRHKDSAAKGLDTTLEWSFETWSTLKTSPAFAAALPSPRRVELGIQQGTVFDLGVDYYNFQPDTIVFVRKGSVGDQAGFKEGDRLLGADGRSVNTIWQLQDIATSGQKRMMMVRVGRAGAEQLLHLAVPGGSSG